MLTFVQELKLLLHRSTLLYSQGKMYGYIDTLLTMLAMLLKVSQSLQLHCKKLGSCDLGQDKQQMNSGGKLVSGFIILLGSNLAGSLQYWCSCL